MLAESTAVTAAPTRAQIETVERTLLTLPQRQIETVQWLHGGLLYRQITIPADTFATGAIQLGDHVSVMVSGTMMVSTDAGMELVSGFRAWPGRAGLKRIGYAYTQTVWLTVHRTNAQTVDDAERELFADADRLLSNRQAQIERDRADYLAVLRGAGISHEVARHETEHHADLIPFAADHGVRLGPSMIDGTGLFTTVARKPGDVIAPGRIGNCRTPAGRFTNHAANPNAKPALRAGGVDIVATRAIGAGDEVTIDYREALRIAGRMEATA